MDRTNVNSGNSAEQTMAKRLASLVPNGRTIADYADLIRTPPFSEGSAPAHLKTLAMGGSGLRMESAPHSASTIGPSLAEMTYIDGSERRFVIHPGEISALGMSFLHCAFVHDGTAVNLRLVLPDGEKIGIQGTVRGCVLIRGRAHAVGIVFKQPLSDAVLHGITGFTPATAELAPRAA